MAGPDTSGTEIDRLTGLYEDYDGDRAARERWSLENRGNRAIHAERAARCRRHLAGVTGAVLDLGCGDGQVLDELAGDLPPGARVGVDLSARRLAWATARVPGAGFARAEGSALPFPSQSFGLVLAFTVFSSILDPVLSAGVAGDIARVLRPGGRVLWYDLRRSNPSNPAVRGIAAAEVQCLFPGWTSDLAPVTVLPPVARRLGPATGALYPALARIRPLASHLLGTLAKPA